MCSVSSALRHDAAAMVHQVGQHAELVAGQLDRRAVDGRRCADRADRARRGRTAAPASPVRWRGGSARAAAPALPPSRNGFVDVVVGAAVDAAAPSRASCRAPSAPAPARAMPASRQRRSSVRPSIFGSPRSSTTASYCSVVAEEIGALAVGRAVDGIAGVGQRCRQLLRQQRFVFDDQHPHVELGIRYSPNDAERRLNVAFRMGSRRVS